MTKKHVLDELEVDELGALVLGKLVVEVVLVLVLLEEVVLCGDGAKANTSSGVCADFNLSMTAVNDPFRFFTCSNGEDLSAPPLLPLSDEEDDGDDDDNMVDVVVVAVGEMRFCDKDDDENDMLCDGDALGELAADLRADMEGFPPDAELGCFGEEILVCLGLA